MKRILEVLAVLALAAMVPAQRLFPWNVEFHPGVIARPFSYHYRPALLLTFDPRVSVPFAVLYPVGLAPQLTLRELLVEHEPGWMGQCPTRLSDPWFYGPMVEFPWTGSRVEYWQNLAVPFYSIGLYRLDYGGLTWNCSAAYAPELAAMVIEVQ